MPNLLTNKEQFTSLRKILVYWKEEFRLILLPELALEHIRDRFQNLLNSVLFFGLTQAYGYTISVNDETKIFLALMASNASITLLVRFLLFNDPTRLFQDVVNYRAFVLCLKFRVRRNSSIV
jgi:hypothetical protein